MIRPVVSIITMLVMPFALAAAGQQHERPNAPPPPPAETPPVDPDIERFKHVIDVQATGDQARKFHTMTASTELARYRARELQRQGAASSDIVEVVHRATTLEDDIDQALTDYRVFRRSLSDPQEVELKNFMKKLIKSVHVISKETESLSKQLDRIPVDAAKLHSLGEQLEKELSALQSAQTSLGKEMSIQPN